MLDDVIDKLDLKVGIYMANNIPQAMSPF